MADIIEVDVVDPSDENKPEAIAHAKREKKTIWQRIKASIFVAGPKEIKAAIIEDVILPAIKDTFADTMYSIVDVAVYGRNASRHGRSRSGRRGSSRSSSSVIDYNKESTKNRNRSRSTRGSSGYDFDNVIFDSREEADEVFQDLVDTLNEYGEVTVYYFYERSGITAEFPDQDWGWKSLDGTGYIYTSEGISLDLPKPVWLK